jgi:hypothetical protein
MPDIHPVLDLSRDVFGVGELGKLPMTVHCQPDEHERGDTGCGNREEPRLAVVHGVPSDIDACPVNERHRERVEHCAKHQREYDNTQNLQWAV